jgi:RNA polymerase subunit RPABC4/transcription elongation factor Spt4
VDLEVVCPSCGEDDRSRLKPKRESRRPRHEDKRLQVTCRSCGHEWTHNTNLCPECREAELAPVRMPLLQKARGTQQSIIGYRTARKCPACGWTSEGPPETNAVE